MKNYFEERTEDCAKKMKKIYEGLPSFAESYFIGIEQTTSPLTRLNYAYDLRVFFDYLYKNLNFWQTPIDQLQVSQLDDISADIIERFLSYITFYSQSDKSHKNSDLGKSRKLSSLRSFFSYFYGKGRIKENVTLKVKMPKVHDKPIIQLEPNEVVDLIYGVESGLKLTEHEQAFHEKTKERDVAIVTLLLGTGIRVSECVGMNLDDIDWQTNGIRITRKGGNQEIVYFSDEVRQYLVAYYRERVKNKDVPRYENALFLSIQNKRISVRSVEILIKKYASRSTPLKKITPHKLRSTFGTQLYRETNDIYLVADILGHKDVNTTKKHYAAQSDTARRDAANIIKLRDNGQN